MSNARRKRRSQTDVQVAIYWRRGGRRFAAIARRAAPVIGQRRAESLIRRFAIRNVLYRVGSGEWKQST